MFEKKERMGLMVYLHYNRDARKIAAYGDVLYHSRRMRYLLLYIDQQAVSEVIQQLEKEKCVKKVLPSFFKDVDHQFVGNLTETNKKTLS